MIKQSLRAMALALVSGLATMVQAQTIETPANTALTITSDMNMNSGKSVQVDGTNFIKLAPATSGNVFMGSSAGAVTNSASGGVENTFIGNRAGSLNTTNGRSTYIGFIAGEKSTGANNTFVGGRAGANNTTGANNLFLGASAGANNVGGSGNFMMGNAAGQANTSGGGNIYIGDGAGLNGNASNNLAIGQYAGANLTGTSTNNVSIGPVASYYATNCSNSVFLGLNAGVPQANLASTFDNVIAIGANSVVTASNSVILGTAASKVGLGGVSAPANTIHLGTALAGTAGIRLPITSGTPAVATNVTKFLSVNAAGDVILASLNASTREGVADAGMWQTSGDNIVNTNAGGVVIGTGVAKTPVGYKLYVAGGMLTEKVKVALRNKSEWSDFVFEKGYKLAPLSEVSAFIKANGHLPGVPSADEMVSEGLDVAKMNAKLLEKVEELTLYMLNQQKQIQKLQNDNKKIKQQLKSRR